MGHQRRQNLLQNCAAAFEVGTLTSGSRHSTTGGRMTNRGQGAECASPIDDRATDIVTGVLTFTVTKGTVIRIVITETPVVRHKTNATRSIGLGTATTIVIIREHRSARRAAGNRETMGKWFCEVRMRRTAIYSRTAIIGCGITRCRCDIGLDATWIGVNRRHCSFSCQSVGYFTSWLRQQCSSGDVC